MITNKYQNILPRHITFISSTKITKWKLFSLDKKESFFNFAVH